VWWEQPFGIGVSEHQPHHGRASSNNVLIEDKPCLDLIISRPATCPIAAWSLAVILKNANAFMAPGGYDTPRQRA
jgi:hypothetical protein